MLSRSGRDMQISDIPIFQLETGVQRDYDSCGLFALNSIGHHYLPWKFPLLEFNHLLLAKFQIEIALELLQGDTVSIFS
jgi:hypothetical protein